MYMDTVFNQRNLFEGNLLYYSITLLSSSVTKTNLDLERVPKSFSGGGK